MQVTDYPKHFDTEVKAQGEAERLSAEYDSLVYVIASKARREASKRNKAIYDRLYYQRNKNKIKTKKECLKRNQVAETGAGLTHTSGESAKSNRQGMPESNGSEATTKGNTLK